MKYSTIFKCCDQCEIAKPYFEYSEFKTSEDGLSATCNTCINRSYKTSRIDQIKKMLHSGEKVAISTIRPTDAVECVTCRWKLPKSEFRTLRGYSPSCNECYRLSQSHSKIVPTERAIVYFVSIQEYVKIGVTRDLNRRIAELQTSVPYEIQILKAIWGDAVAEKTFHKKFSHLRVRGEWFKKDENLLAFIDQLDDIRSQGAPFISFDEWRQILSE